MDVCGFKGDDSRLRGSKRFGDDSMFRFLGFVLVEES